MTLSADDPLALIPAGLEDAFCRELRQGRRPRVEDYIHQCGDGSIVREYFELLQYMEAGTAGPAVAVPQRLSGYTTHAVLGRGAMSTVYRARQLSTGTEVALKVLTSPCGSLQDRFLREADIMRRLDHPGIVRLLETWVDGSHCVHVMPLIRGRTLEVESARRVDTPGSRAHQLSICRWGQQIADALQHAHERGIIHRDIKPGNVMIDEQEQAVIIDFGLSRSGDRLNLSNSGDAIGTPRYMAPEQFRGRSDARSDIYSVGVVLWQLITGELPWESHRGSASAVRLPDTAAAAPNVLPALGRLIDDCCHDRPERRPRTAAELRGRLLRLATTLGHCQ
ncbi:MAG: serine/threonine protein kinase [Planctomycetaceae bacterium]|nr:serine/threonine protein kinase [Planctomycetaceae bacterium]